mmetsp:Transcript_13454/g.21975  ORF Transcript_13454/g.21975 Transcript_13454/m.21975 type:complete len:586 (-) Transcript_13454:250-2007(-)
MMYHAVSAPASLGTRNATAPISASARRVRAVRAAVSEPPPTSPSASPFVPRWNLSRAPLGPGVEPAPGTWVPTDQTIDDWRSIYRNTTLSTTDGNAPRTISSARVTGVIPHELTGTLFRNGPGLLEVYGKKLNQFFDGDGLIYSIAFEAGALTFKHNFVGTKGFTEERAAQKMLYKGAFAIGNPKGDAFYNPFDFDVKNVANTGVVDWAGELYALWEGGKPHKMDPVSLRTEGEADVVLGQALEVPQMAAHYRVIDAADPADKRLVAFSIEAQNSFMQPNRCCFYEWDVDGKQAARQTFGVPDATFGFFHDCLVTENWYMLVQNPTALDPQKLLTEYMFAKCALAQVIAFQDGKSALLHMLPRTEKARAIGQQAIPLANQFFFHHVNAFEPAGCNDASQVVFDSAPWKFMDFGMNLDMVTPAFWDGGSRVEYTRFDVNVARGTSKQESLSNRVMEFPQVNHRFTGQAYRYVYSAGAAVKDDVKWGPNQCLVKFDTSPEVGVKAEEQTYYFGERSFVQEPIFCARPGAVAEDDGWVLLVVNDAGEDLSRLHIFDAADIAAGPVATVELEDHLPPGLHGYWSNAVHK